MKIAVLAIVFRKLITFVRFEVLGYGYIPSFGLNFFENKGWFLCNRITYLWISLLSGLYLIFTHPEPFEIQFHDQSCHIVITIFHLRSSYLKIIALFSQFENIHEILWLCQIYVGDNRFAVFVRILFLNFFFFNVGVYIILDFIHIHSSLAEFYCISWLENVPEGASVHQDIQFLLNKLLAHLWDCHFLNWAD